MRLNTAEVRPMNGSDKPEFTVPKHIVKHTLALGEGSPVYWEIQNMKLYLSREESDDKYTITETSVHQDQNAVSPQCLATILGLEVGDHVIFEGSSPSEVWIDY